MHVVLCQSLAALPAATWDALVGDDNPFVEHAWLHGLEVSGSVGQGTGWLPLHLLLIDGPAGTDAAPLAAGGQLVGAAPAYLKTDSYGEFIFDWAWAEFHHRNGAPYYPKLVVGVPYTPATGPRLLLSPRCPDPAEAERLLAGALLALATRLDASSVHWLFTTAAEATRLGELGYSPRLSSQNMWFDQDYGDFDGFLGAMRAPARKGIRRERRLANGHGLHIEVTRGPEMDRDQWEAVQGFYRMGCAAYGSHPYLTEAMFDWIRDHFAERVVCSLARSPDGSWVAGTLNFHKGRHLYGRYWGTTANLDCLHFELAYYRLIEHCLANGWTRFEAGAGGGHKVRRGLTAHLTHSAHRILRPAFAAVIDDHIGREAEHLRQAVASSAARGCFRRGA